MNKNQWVQAGLIGAIFAGVMTAAPSAQAGEPSRPGNLSSVDTPGRALPDLSPAFEDRSFRITQRLGGNTLEFGTYTTNIGGRDWHRPFQAGTSTCTEPFHQSDFRIANLYHYTLYHQTGTDPVTGDPTYEVISEQNKPTICTIDSVRFFALECIQEGRTTAQFTCSCTQGISRGLSDSYFRGLTGQWVFIGSATGSFMLVGELDPAQELQAADIPDDSADAVHDNNFATAFFDYDGGLTITSTMTHTAGNLIDGYNAANVCMSP